MGSLLERLQKSAAGCDSGAAPATEAPPPAVPPCTRPDLPVCGGGRGRFSDEQVCLRCVDLTEDERQRIAMDLHDGPLQQLVNMAMRLDMARDTLPPEAAEARAELDGLLEFAHRQVADMRRFMFELRPAARLAFSLVPLLRQYVEDYTKQFGTPVELHLREEEWALGPAAEAATFRIIQEALTNVRKHARASLVVVALRRGEGQAEVTITDNGRGFDVAEARARAAANRSLGLVGMEDRAVALGGTVAIESRPGETRVRATFPVPE